MLCWFYLISTDKVMPKMVDMPANQGSIHIPAGEGDPVGMRASWRGEMVVSSAFFAYYFYFKAKAECHAQCQTAA